MPNPCRHEFRPWNERCISLIVVPLSARVPSAKELVGEIEKALEVLSDDSLLKRVWKEIKIGRYDLSIVAIQKSNTERKPSYQKGTYWLMMDDGNIKLELYRNDDVFNVMNNDDLDLLIHPKAARGVSYWDESYFENLSEQGFFKTRPRDFSIDKAASIGHWWAIVGDVRRSSNVWIFAGIVAVALARLTDGLITSDDEGADCTKVPSNPDYFLEWFPEWCEKEYSSCEAVNFSDAYQALSTAYPSMVFEKNGFLYDGEYILRSKGSSGQGPYFGVTQASGKITVSPRWSSLKPHKRVAVYSENEVKQIEDKVIATGLCHRDEQGRVVTNSGDCYLTLVDGHSVWIPLKHFDDYTDDWRDFSRKNVAIRPYVEVYPHKVGDGEGGYTEHYWMVGVMRDEKGYLRRHNPKNNPLDRNLPSNEQLPEWAFCIVGNVVEKRFRKSDNRIIQGTKHFRPGAKLYILDGLWGMGAEHVIVMGQPRNKRTLIKIIFKRDLIQNFRVKQVYDKRVIRELYLPFGEADLQTSELKRELEERVKWWNVHAESVAADFQKQIENAEQTHLEK